MKHFGKIIIIIGLLTIIPIGLHLGMQSGAFGTLSTAPPTPVGIGGYVYDTDNTYVEDGTPVYAKNLETEEVVTRFTQNNGIYAIPISARTGDRIKVTAIHQNPNLDLKAEKTIVADQSKPTQWCNLTMGVEHKEDLDLWMGLIPIGLVCSGLMVEYVNKKK